MTTLDYFSTLGAAKQEAKKKAERDACVWIVFKDSIGSLIIKAEWQDYPSHWKELWRTDAPCTCGFHVS